VVTHERDVRAVAGRQVTLADGRVVMDESAATEVTP
jgi:ABC-type lipoprotein export system ATPase subunit